VAELEQLEAPFLGPDRGGEERREDEQDERSHAPES
jgi:hypothetical protein